MIKNLFLFGLLLFSYKHIVKPVAHGGKAAGKLVYRAVV